MGTIVEDFVIVTCFEVEHLRQAYKQACNLFGDWLVTPPLQHRVNRGQSFMVVSSGSKNGWIEKQDHQEKISEFMKWCDDTNLFNKVAVVEIGGDNWEPRVVDSYEYEEKQ